MPPGALDRRPGAERGEKDAEHGEEAGIVQLRQGEVDDSGGADDLDRSGEELAEGDDGPRILDDEPRITNGLKCRTAPSW